MGVPSVINSKEKAMGGAMPLFVIAGIAFIVWLMWSSESDKQVFLLYMWAAAIGFTVLYAAYHWLF